jgi:hypothetical protein
MLQDLPQELHELITDNLPVADYISYRNSLGLVSGRYRGRKVDVQGEFRKEVKNSGMFRYYWQWNRISEDSLNISWKIMVLFLGTKRINLSEICENEQSDEDEDGDYSFGLILGFAVIFLKRWNIARLLLDEEWEGDKEDLSELLVHCMSSDGHISLQFIELMLADKRVDPSALDNDAIRWASANGHHKCVALLLADERVDPTDEDNEAIKAASCYGHHECVALLLADQSVDPSAENNYAIRWASADGHHECVALLLADERVDPSAKNNQAIREASGNAHSECVALLWADPRVQERRVTRALQRAIEKSLAHSSV